MTAPGNSTPTMSMPGHAPPAGARAPRIRIELSLSPAAYSFSSPDAPTMNMRITLVPGNAATPSESEPRAVTLYIERSPLHRRWALVNSGFIIVDLATGQEVPSSTISGCRGPNPRLRVRGSYEEQFFLTLWPGTPVDLAFEFSRGRRPLPWSIVQLGTRIDDHGWLLENTRDPASVMGVDGLMQGHEYDISLNMEPLRKIMWAPVPKDDILLESLGPGPRPCSEDFRADGTRLSDYPWERKPLDFQVIGTRLRVLEGDLE